VSDLKKKKSRHSNSEEEYSLPIRETKRVSLKQRHLVIRAAEQSREGVQGLTGKEARFGQNSTQRCGSGWTGHRADAVQELAVRSKWRDVHLPFLHDKKGGVSHLIPRATGRRR